MANVNEGDIDDLIFICSSKHLSDPKYAKGIELKIKWLLKTMKKVEVCAKIAYFDGKPVARYSFSLRT
ncbi:MAG TPA: hypothetical protein EYP68_03015 [Candidatus Korarchaeota archaeon]|nr:hypothetical protein [Candidatus Korarchaeota archaeon]